LAQLNREAEKSDRPQLSHLRESGAIEQDADAVLFLHRIDDKTVNLGIAKHRHAGAGDLLLDWIPHRTRFADYGEANGAKRVPDFDDFNASGTL
jgi:replicative DNA helicase